MKVFWRMAGRVLQVWARRARAKAAALNERSAALEARAEKFFSRVKGSVQRDRTGHADRERLEATYRATIDKAPEARRHGILSRFLGT